MNIGVFKNKKVYRTSDADAIKRLYMLPLKDRVLVSYLEYHVLKELKPLLNEGRSYELMRDILDP